jgi:UDP-N-acetylmuramate: L-alanyl-gamma-D-glutamyl-meso-diaminopimelate ligase
MHIHILGICGTFMGSLAILARSAGHTVTGCDTNVYPPMSTQLESQGIQLIQGFEIKQLDTIHADLFIIGNIVSRGNPLMEEILNRKLAYTSGPQWLGENILNNKHVLAIAGTHGKTTTSTMLTWILEYAGYEPSYLIGGVPLNFEASAHLNNNSQYFVIEADEYDTAFFDKRSKFVHYRPKTAVLNNLEFDHADIFASIDDIEKQFNHLIRTIPANGKIIANKDYPAIDRTIQKGMWSKLEYFSENNVNNISDNVAWRINPLASNTSHFEIYHNNKLAGVVEWNIIGKHNQMNALATIACAYDIGISIETSIKALNNFNGVKRRMELKASINNVMVYDDFAHHPSAITSTLHGLKNKISSSKNKTAEYILAILEPRSNTMKMGAIKDALPESLALADYSFVYTDRKSVSWDAQQVFAPLGNKVEVISDFDILLTQIINKTKAIKQINTNAIVHLLIMSNGGFCGIHDKIIDKIK